MFTEDYCLQTYRTGTGRLEVDFLFYNLRGNRGWRIYIISQIFYGRKANNSHAAHWLQDEYEPYPYICWDNEIPDLDSAKPSLQSGQNAPTAISTGPRTSILLQARSCDKYVGATLMTDHRR